LFNKVLEPAVVQTVIDVVIPPMAEGILQVSVPHNFYDELALLESHAITQHQQRFAVAKCLVRVQKVVGGKTRRASCRIINLLLQPCRIRRGTVLAIIHEINAIVLANKSRKATFFSGATEVSVKEKIQKINQIGLQIDRHYLDDVSYKKLCRPNL